MMSEALDPVLLPGGPYDALVKKFTSASVEFDPGFDTAEAVRLAHGADVAIVFVTRHASEGKDALDLTLPMRQDGLVEAIAAVNPNTIVVVQTGQPITMPWADKVKGIVAAFFPGQRGAEAIADIVYGDANPSGHLPITFPASIDQLPRPAAPAEGVVQFEPSTVEYKEGSDVGYRWMARTGAKPLFAFGEGLSYTSFAYDRLKVKGGKTLSVTFDVINTGKRAGADVPQVYLTDAAGRKMFRLIGFKRVDLAPGARRTVTLTADRRLLARFEEARPGWLIEAGTYTVMLGKSSIEPVLMGSARIAAQVLKP
jgi:beta-glucosidase